MKPLPQVEEENFVANSWAASAETLTIIIIIIIIVVIYVNNIVAIISNLSWS